MKAVCLLALVACGTPQRPPDTGHLKGQEVHETPGPPGLSRSSHDPVSVAVTPDTPTGDAAKRDAEFAAKAAPLLDAFTNTQPVFTRDTKRVVFVSDRDGLPQLYVADGIDRPATRLLATTERVNAPLTTEDGKHVVFTSDHGADENWSVFRVGLDGKDLVELTHGTLNRDLPFIPDGKPSTLYFTARDMASAKSTLFTASAIAAGEAKPIFTTQRTGFLGDVSRDGKSAVVMELPSMSNNMVHLVDVDTGKAKQLFPASGQVTINDARFTRDGRSVLVATDNGEEQAYVLSFDLQGKRLAKHAFTPPTAEVMRLVVAKEGGLVAVLLGVGNHNEVHLLDSRSLSERATVRLPAGIGDLGEFSLDGKRLLVHWSTPESPTDLISIDTATGKLVARSEKHAANGPAIDSSAVEIPAHDGGKIPTNLYIAKGEQTKRHPVIVSFHGGPAGVSRIRWSPFTAFLIAQGYVVVEPNVRGSTGFGRAYEAADNGAKRVEALKDIETAARWVAAQPWADKDRLVVSGGSYGGYSTLVALTRWPELWRAGVDAFGPPDLRSVMKSTSGVIRDLFLVELGDPDKEADLYKQLSPIHQIDHIVDPLFVYAGANDPRVPRIESDTVVRALRSRKVTVEYMVAANEGHSLDHRDTQIAFFSRVARFLESALR